MNSNETEMNKKYPEHAKLRKIHDKSQAIGEFLEFSGYELCEYKEDTDEFEPVPWRIEGILAKYFEIDLDVLEQEKQTMLEELSNGS